jgi:lipopolysaccharide export system ATP-binding protein
MRMKMINNNHQKLSTKGLYKQYGKRMVVRDVDLDVNKGEIVGLLGPNGAGKTTTFYMITGMIKPTKGKIFLDKNNITNRAMYQRSRSGIGYLSQEPSIFGKLSVEDNLRLVLEMTDMTKEKQSEKVEKLLDDLSIQHIRKNIGNNLSGGERRRVEISRTLAIDPDFILLDEPFAGVDPIAVEDIQSIVISLKERNIGVLITDHNVRETLTITDRSYLLFDGKILKSGTSESLANDEEARRLYLGEKFRL